MEKEKIVTLEAFEQYHKKLMEFIGLSDDSILNIETDQCDEEITDDKSENETSD